jgi:sugar phosphate permease
VLAAGTLSQASLLAFLIGTAVLAPALRDELGLSLTQVGVVLAAPWIGPIGTLLPWGLLADRAGERRVLAGGLAVCGALVVPAAWISSFAALVVVLGVAGAAGASVNSASGRAVMSWFGPEERGLALGVRQSSTPLGGFLAALLLPVIESAGGLKAAFLFLGCFILVAAGVGWAIVRDVPGQGVVGAQNALRDPRLWRIGLSSAFYLVAQTAIVSFVVLFLHDERDLSTGAAAGLLAAIQALAIATRIAIGRWSDVSGTRIVPLRWIGVGTAVSLGAVAALLTAPLPVLLALFLVAGVFATAWNGLAFTVAAELAGRGRSGAATGFQQTILSATGAAVPPAFAAGVSLVSWTAAFALAAAFPVAGWWALRPLTESQDG